MKGFSSVLLFFIYYFLPAQTYDYYFGNLHAHTAFSDGNKDSSITGVARPDAAYAYAKLSDNFDFLGISEHNHYSNLHNPGFLLKRFQPGINMANAANEDGVFFVFVWDRIWCFIKLQRARCCVWLQSINWLGK